MTLEGALSRAPRLRELARRSAGETYPAASRSSTQTTRPFAR
jgi:hypothetical protein